MGRFLSGGSGSVPRKHSIRLLASNPSVPIPSWARVAYITGCGGGSSGGIGNAGTTNGGAAGAFAIRHPVLIPADATTLAAVIGAAGAAVTGAAAAHGNIGGATTVTMAATVLRLNGGGNGLAGSGYTVGGWPYVNSTAFSNGGSFVGSGWLGMSAGAATLGVGADGGTPNQNSAFGAGAASPFGAAQIRTSNVTSNSPGFDAQGYGAGGTSAVTSGGSVTSGAGSQGFLLIEFEEATTA